MKYIKMLVVLLLLISTGCKVEYNLEYKDELKEKIIISFSRSECELLNTNCDEYIKNQANMLIKNEKYADYKIEVEKLSNEYVATFTYTYENFKEWEEKNVYNMAFINSEITEDKVKLSEIIMPDEGVRIEHVNVFLTTNRPVKISNADFVDKENGEYSWRFIPNGDNSNLDIEFDKTRESILDGTTTLFIGILIIIIVAIIGFVVVKVLIVHSNRHNKI